MINPVLKEKARDAVARAIETGILERPSRCERCGAQVRVEAHHPNYLKPLFVEWLCVACHGAKRKRRNPPRFDTRMWPELRQRLRVAAAVENVAIWRLIEQAITEYLDKKEAEK